MGKIRIWLNDIEQKVRFRGKCTFIGGATQTTYTYESPTPVKPTKLEKSK